MKDRGNRKVIITVLAILLAINVIALTGIVLVKYFSFSEPVSEKVTGNIITPDSEDNSDIKNEPAQDSTESGNAATVPENKTKAGALSLHNRNSENNMVFQAANLFPGDSETKYYCVKVFYKGDIVVRYHADIRPGYEKLAEVLKVRIRLIGTDETLYDGLMRDMPQSLEHALYTSKSTQSELNYEITAYLETSVGNEYMDKNLIADFRWWVEETENLDSPQTSDNFQICLWVCVAAGSLILLLILLSKRRKEAVNEAEKQ